MKLALVVKTSIDHDGRVISQIDHISKEYPEMEIEIYLLSDKKYNITFKKNVKVKEIKLFSRRLPKNMFFKFFKMFEFFLKTLFKLVLFKPNLIHAHDDNAILGPLIYKMIYKSNVILIYDDHELRNIPPCNMTEKIMFYLEKTIIKKSDLVIVANYARKRFINIIFNPKRCLVVENMCYERNKNSLKSITEQKIKEIKNLKRNGKKVLLHQGVINKNRKADLIEKMIFLLPDNWVIYFIGVNTVNIPFNIDFIKDKIRFGGFIPYENLSNLWYEVDGVAMFYGTHNLNNKYCAPNRMYLAANLGKPIISNDNPTLKKFIINNGFGVVINSSNINSQLELYFRKFEDFKYQLIKQKNKLKFNYNSSHPIIKIYDEIINR